ncbi:MAG: hypothetical protein JXR07_11505 [Reichenbachiella sp.]
MEKSIENIWNEGFLKSGDLVIPKVNDLYNRKSKHLIDKMTKALAIDHWSLIPVTIGLISYILYLGSTWVAIYTFILMGALFYHNRKIYERILTVDKTGNSYQYLKTFNGYIKSAIRTYTKMFIFLYPFFIIPIYWVIFRKQEWVEKLMDKPYLELVLYSLGTVLFISAAGALAYRLMVKLVYGRMCNRLNDLINDMEELRK